MALPIIVILGTASVAAIVSVSFEGATPIVADQPDKSRDPALRPGAIVRPSVETHRTDPVSSVGIAVAGPQELAPGEGRASDLPILSVLQPRREEPAARPRAAARALAPTPPPTRAWRSVPAGERSRALATECVEGCDDPTGLPPSPARATDVVQFGARLNEPVVAPAADDYRGSADLPGPTEPPAPDAAVAAANLAGAPILVADSRPALLAEPTGELVADSHGVDAAPLAAIETRPTEAEASLVGSENAGTAEVESFQQSQPSGDVAGERVATGAGSSIPEHLARIGERYAATPIAEPAAPDRAMVEHESASAEQPALVERSVALDLNGSVASSVIVQDDELVAIRLGELVSLLEDRLDHPLYVWMSSASVASKFVTAQTLAAAGIRTRYDPERRQLVISTTGE